MNNRVPAIADVRIGALLVDPQGDLYVVTQVDERGYLTAELDYVVSEMRTTPSGGMTHDWGDGVADDAWPDECYPQTLAGLAAPEVIDALTEHIARQREIDEVWAHVPAGDHPQLFNTLSDARVYTHKLQEAQDKVAEYAKDRARELRKVVEMTGSQERAAKLLGMNQSTLSRALRPRN